jgi:hypothetical protein
MNPERLLIDPEGRYEVDGLRLVEAHALNILKLLPGARVERARDAIQIEQGGQEGIVLLLTPEVLEVRLPTVEWTHPHCPARSSRLWKRVDWISLDAPALTELLTEAQKARASQFRKCRYCGKRFPPEHLHEKDVCHGCAESHLGVVH